MVEDPVLPDTSLPLKQAREQWTSTLERRYCSSLFARHGDNVSRAARATGVDRMYFYRLLWKRGLE